MELAYCVSVCACASVRVCVCVCVAVFVSALECPSQSRSIRSFLLSVRRNTPVPVTRHLTHICIHINISSCFPPGSLEAVYESLVDANPNLSVYKKEDIPDHLHYKHNGRIMPILLEAQEGWTIVQSRSWPFMCT